MEHGTRASWHCGWMEREEWTNLALDKGMFDGQFQFENGDCCDVCPGYLATLPQVREAADATWAIRERCLPLYFPQATSVLLSAAKELDIAYKVFEAKRTAELNATQTP